MIESFLLADRDSREHESNEIATVHGGKDFEMLALRDQTVLVLGLGGRGQAACELLCRNEVKVVALDSRDTPELRVAAESLRASGIAVTLGAAALPRADFALAVLSPAVPLDDPLVQAVKATGVPLIGELELGFQQARCLSIAISGTNGKSTTAALVERLLTASDRATLVAGHRGRPVCSVAEQTRELDFLILQAEPAQLESTEFLRPAVAVLLNLVPDAFDRRGRPADYPRALARLFRNQQVFDWAVVQSEALAQLRALGLPVPGKVITFSATEPAADLHLDRGLLISRLPNWSGPLLDLEQCRLRGPHHAENLMAALAVGHVLRLSLEDMVEPLKAFAPLPHRCEVIAEFNGVQFVDDAKSRNLDALHKSLLAARPGPAGQPNIWLIAGGADPGLDFHDVGPVLSSRVKGAFLFGAAAEKIRAAWSLFTPCQSSGSLLEAVAEAARNAVAGDVVLFSPACPGWDQFRDYQHRGEIFCLAVKSIGGGAPAGTPNINGKTPAQ